MLPLVDLLSIKILLLELILINLINYSLKLIQFPRSFSLSKKTYFFCVINDYSCFSIVSLIPECYIPGVIHEPLPTNIEFKHWIHPFYLMTVIKS